jgi:hypothetical protein
VTSASSRSSPDSSSNGRLICVSMVYPDDDAARVETFGGAFGGMVPRFQKGNRRTPLRAQGGVESLRTRCLLYAVTGVE